jgi:hypothetical protein
MTLAEDKRDDMLEEVNAILDKYIEEKKEANHAKH